MPLSDFVSFPTTFRTQTPLPMRNKMALTNKTNIRKRTVMDGLKKTFGKASQAISEKVFLTICCQLVVDINTHINSLTVFINFFRFRIMLIGRRWTPSSKIWNVWLIIRRRLLQSCWIILGSFCSQTLERDYKRDKSKFWCVFLDFEKDEVTSFSDVINSKKLGVIP